MFRLEYYLLQLSRFISFINFTLETIFNDFLYKNFELLNFIALLWSAGTIYISVYQYQAPTEPMTGI